jgi:hypothetical protein
VISDWRLAPGREHEGTIAAEPAFVEYSRTGTPDFRLSSRSPAIGRGFVVDAPEPDFEGKPRSTEAGFDIGAYQHERLPDGEAPASQDPDGSR